MRAVSGRKSAGNSSYSTCDVCGKQVYTGMLDKRQWAYKEGHKFACSYTCYNKLINYRRKHRK